MNNFCPVPLVENYCYKVYTALLFIDRFHCDNLPHIVCPLLCRVKTKGQYVLNELILYI